MGGGEEGGRPLRDLRAQVMVEVPGDTVEVDFGSLGRAGGGEKIKEKHRGIRTDKRDGQVGRLGGGNHFTERGLEEADAGW